MDNTQQESQAAATKKPDKIKTVFFGLDTREQKLFPGMNAEKHLSKLRELKKMGILLAFFLIIRDI